jgi:hypothetical protein
VVETRYVDADYRSEYSAFYSRAFVSQPDSAHRLHFFRAPLNDSQLWDLPKDHGYLGYMVIRPSTLGQVGRCVLQAPPGLKEAVRTAVVDYVTFFGQRLSVFGVPFMQQDTQLGRCAHAAAWMCHYNAYRTGHTSRRSMAAFSLSANPALGLGRPLPSEGLTVEQLLDLMRVLELPPSYYNTRLLPPGQLAPFAAPDPVPPVPAVHPGLWDTKIIRICCRYLNSGIPVLVATSDHAFVLCGYRRVAANSGHPDWIEFVRHDDQRGPYLPVQDVFADVAADGYRYSPWQALIVPLPEKLWLPPEPAEATGGVLMHSLAVGVGPILPEAQRLVDAVDNQNLSLHTYAVRASDYKIQLDKRGLDPGLVREYKLARWPRFIWVVEGVDRVLRRSGVQECVLGEVILDATSSETSPHELAIHVPGLALVTQTSGQRRPIRCAPTPYRSGGVGAP